MSSIPPTIWMVKAMCLIVPGRWQPGFRRAALPILLLTCLVAQRGSAQLNLLPQGDFEHPDLNTDVYKIADLTVTPHMAAPAQLADAVLPAGVNLDWGKAKVRTLNAKRAQVSLDGIWRFAPSSEGPAPKLGWGYIKVPGDWQARPNRPSAIVSPGGGAEWSHYDGSRV